MRPPKLTIDEVILLIDTYFSLGNIKDVDLDNDDRIVALSEILKRLPIHSLEKRSNEFRSPQGMKMLLLNVASIDPATGIKLNNGSKLQKMVYNEFLTRKELLHSIARAIKSCSSLPFDYNKAEEEEAFLGGNILLQYHKYIETKTSMAQLILKEALRRRVSTCYICEADLHDKYREKSYQIMELHYATEIYELNNKTSILSSKFIKICPNCHKLSHSNINLFEENRLKHFIKHGV